MILHLSKKRWLALLLALIIGLGLTAAAYFATNIYSQDDVALITDNHIKDVLVKNDEDVYKNKDQSRMQILHLRMLSGRYQGREFTVHNPYIKSQLQTQKYRARGRVFVKIHKGQPALVNPKRDWVIVLALTFMAVLMIAVSGKHAAALLASMALSCFIFYLVLLWDVSLNGSMIILIFGAADVVFSFFSLLIVQGWSRKMLATWLATLLGVFVSFGLCYLVMILTGESEMRYDTGEYATQDPRGIFLAQTLLGILGAVMDEATDILSSLYELIQTKKGITARDLIRSGRTMGQEIMGPLINVLVLIFVAGALPEMILYLRDNNSIASAFGFTLSLGVTQSIISGIGIVLTVVFATACSLLFLKQRPDRKREAEK